MKVTISLKNSKDVEFHVELLLQETDFQLPWERFSERCLRPAMAQIQFAANPDLDETW